jgi:hypothetical protein
VNKIEPISAIIKVIQPLLTAKTVLYTTLILTLAFWAGFHFPQVFGFFNLDNWRANNDTLMGWGVIATSLLLFVVLSVNVDKWISSWKRKRREKQEFADVLSDLSRGELQYLLQYFGNRTLLMEFDENDPVVGLLVAKALIFPSRARLRLGHVHSFKVRHHPQGYNISPFLYKYLLEHREIFRKLAPKP